MSLVSERGDRGRFATVIATFAVVLILLLALAARAQATENIYWDNYQADPETIAFADITGSGGGALNLTGALVNGPEGMTYDPVTGRLYIAAYENDPDKKGQIVWVSINGSGAGVLNTAGAPVYEPMGIAIDPATRTVYWVNTGSAGLAEGSIGWARLDGSGAGELSTAGATLDGPYRMGFDPTTGKVFWANSDPTIETIGYANINGSGGGTLDISGATPPEGISGFTVDSAAGKLYWIHDDGISFASVNGGGGGNVALGSAPFDGPYGLAFDPGQQKLIWANYGKGEERTDVFGVTVFGGSPGGISIATAPVDGPQDPVIVKSPTGTGAPTVTRDAKLRSKLACSTGSWGLDSFGGNVFQSPNAFTYQWLRNGQAVGGATANTFTAVSAGSYSCVVTGSNPVGSAAQTSTATNVKASKIKLTTKKKAKADAGDLVTFKVKAVNQGDLAAKKSSKLCVKLPKAAKDDLKAPKCKKLGLKGRGKKTLTLKVKVKPAADEGTDKLTFQVKGSAGKAAKSKIVVG